MDAVVPKNGHNDPRAEARFAVPTLPRYIALINADDDARTATAFILGDFEDAFCVYARHDADPDALIPRITRVMPSSLDADSERPRACFDTVVLGCTPSDNGSAERVAGLMRVLVKNGSLGKGARFYAIACTNDYKAECAIASLTRLEAICSEHQLAWCGGLAVGASDMIPATASIPRMGMIRRRLSEATDKLILAVRCGAGAGTITAPAPVPQPIYQLIVEKQLHRY